MSAVARQISILRNESKLKNKANVKARAVEENKLPHICAPRRERKTQIPAIPPPLRSFLLDILPAEAICGRCDPFKDDIRHRSAGISDSRPRIPYNLMGPAGSKLKNKAELTVMSAAVRQILLCIEELHTFNMVSGIDLRHLSR